MFRRDYRQAPGAGRWTRSPAEACRGKWRVPGSARRWTILPDEGALISVQLSITSARPAPAFAWAILASTCLMRSSAAATIASRDSQFRGAGIAAHPDFVEFLRVKRSGTRPVSDTGRMSDRPVLPTLLRPSAFRPRPGTICALPTVRPGPRQWRPVPPLSGFERPGHRAMQEPGPAGQRRRRERALRAQTH